MRLVEWRAQQLDDGDEADALESEDAAAGVFVAFKRDVSALSRA
jgi:hypothetical protein